MIYLRSFAVSSLVVLFACSGGGANPFKGGMSKDATANGPQALQNGGNASGTPSSTDSASTAVADPSAKFTAAELEAVSTHLEAAIPLVVSAIIQRIGADHHLSLPGAPTITTAPYTAIDPTTMTVQRDNGDRDIAIHATVAQSAQTSNLLDLALRLHLVLLDGCLDQQGLLAKMQCLLTGNNIIAASDVGHTNKTPGIKFTRNGNILVASLENPLVGTGTLDTLTYQAALPGTAAVAFQAALGAESGNNVFSFKVPHLVIQVDLGNLFSLANILGAGNGAISYGLSVVVDATAVGGNITINGKSDKLTAALSQATTINVHGSLGSAVTATVNGGASSFSLARHMSSVINLNPDANDPLTIVVALPPFGVTFNPNNLGKMVSAYGAVSAQMTEPAGTAVFKTLSCAVPKTAPVSYQTLVGETVANYGRILETSYGWSDSQFTGNPPGAQAKICTIK